MSVKQEQREELNNFSGGYITEASSLNFPPNAFSEIDNFVIRADGSLARRRGMAIEAGGELVDSGYVELPERNTNSFIWHRDFDPIWRELFVVQTYNKLFFFNMFDNVLSTSLLGTVTITEAPNNPNFYFAATEAALVVAMGTPEIVLIELPSGTQNFTYTRTRLKTRDVWGIEETIDNRYELNPKFRGTSNIQHLYNLQNQSWGMPRRFRDEFNADPIGGSGFPQDMNGKYPSNSDQIWTCIQTMPVNAGETPKESCVFESFVELDGATATAPKGYFIIDVLDRGGGRRAAVAANNENYPTLTGYNTNDFPLDRTSGGPTIIAEFAGRVFYAGFSGEIFGADNRSPSYSNYIFFSQLVKNKSDIHKCYQEGDPTSRDNPDIVDTDGGFLRISEANDVRAMFPIGGSLLVLASNGVWMVSGGSDYGFSATNYKSVRLSEIGVIDAKTVVREGDSCYFWGKDAIYLVARNQLGDYEVTSITDNTIQKYYDSLPKDVKLGAAGAFDPSDKTVRWVFLDEAAGKNREIVLDLKLGCFYKNSMWHPVPTHLKLAAVVPLPGQSLRAIEGKVVVGLDPVFVQADRVVASYYEEIGDAPTTKYLGVIKEPNQNAKIGFFSYTDKNFRDFAFYDQVGTDANAQAITGTTTAGDSAIDKQIPYIVMNFEKTEKEADALGKLFPASGCKIRCMWDFTTDLSSKRWTQEQQAYRFKPMAPIVPFNRWTDGFSVVTTKNKLRGKGKSFSLRLQTEPYKDCRILGWNITATGNPIT